jgi:hypothetical protein
MDPVSAVGVANAVVQFLDYGSKVLKNAIAIYDEASHKSQEEMDVDLVITNLKFCLQSLRDNAHRVPKTTQEEASLEALRVRCELLVKELIDAFGTDKYQSNLANANKPKKIWLSFGHAVRLTAWKKEDIQKLQESLRRLQEQLILNTSADTW